MMSSKFVTMWDLNVGVDINIYGKLFKLVDCDHFTRHFLSCQGVKVPAQIPIPIRYQISSSVISDMVGLRLH